MCSRQVYVDRSVRLSAPMTWVSYRWSDDRIGTMTLIVKPMKWIGMAHESLHKTDS